MTAHARPHKIFSIPEMLEAILLHTDMCTLLTSAQRVCHYWCDPIKEPPSLQAALFFQPVNHEAS
ncbi:hypothetical protein V8E54_011497 [Elaphomyces granulatus]